MEQEESNPPTTKLQDQDKSSDDRATWANPIEFVLTMVGYAVGLGNVWRFPYLCYKNGGGAFLIPYFLMLTLVGLPLFFMEMVFGQFTSLGPLAVWKVNPLMKGVGYAMVVANTIIAVYYVVIISWAVFYFFSSMTYPLPWTGCGHWWNDQFCFESSYLSEYCHLNRTLSTYECHSDNDTVVTINTSDIESPSEQYFYKYALRLSSGMHDLGSVRWQLACCLFLCWVIVFFVLLKGISSLGKVVYFSTTFPYILITVMLLRGVTLPNAGIGIEYYLKPDWSKLTESKVWADAATQIFFSLSVCTGGLIAMSSFNPFHSNCRRDAIMVPIINCMTSFYAGFAIFSVLGFMAGQKGVTVDEVAEAGHGLVFVVYPEALARMPISPLWAILFFFMLITLGFSSAFSMVECTFAAIIDEFSCLKVRRNQTLFRLIMCIVFFLVSLPMVTEGGFYVFSLLDTYISGFPLLFIGVFETILFMYVYGYGHFAEDVVLMIGKHPGWYFKLTLCIFAPSIMIAIIIFMVIQYRPLTLFDGLYVYGGASMILGWGVVIVSLAPIPAVLCYRYAADGGWKLFKHLTSPSPSWGPAKPANRSSRYSITVERNMSGQLSGRPSNYSKAPSYQKIYTLSSDRILPSIWVAPAYSYENKASTAYNGISNGGAQTMGTTVGDILKSNFESECSYSTNENLPSFDDVILETMKHQTDFDCELSSHGSDIACSIAKTSL